MVSNDVAEWLCDAGVPLKGWEWTMLLPSILWLWIKSVLPPR